MIEIANQKLFYRGSIDKQIKFTGIGTTVNITNKEIVDNKFTLHESLNSNSGATFQFGICESNYIEVEVFNVINSVKNKKFSVTMSVIDEGETVEIPLGTFKVISDKPTADRKRRTLVMYDALYDVLSSDYADWYNELEFPMTIKQFRNSFFSHVGITQNSASLCNDSIEIGKGIEPQVLTGKDILTAICELNGVFGHITRYNKFDYISLPSGQGLYPSTTLYPKTNLFPLSAGARQKLNGSYQNCTYEDYLVQPITKVVIKSDAKNVGGRYGTDGNTYIVLDNFLTYGFNAQKLQNAATNLWGILSDYAAFRPYECNAMGNPCVEVGDGIILSTKSITIKSFVFSRTLKGVQSLRDNYFADATEYQDDKNNNDIVSSFKQVENKSMIISQSVDGLNINVEDLARKNYNTGSYTVSKKGFGFPDYDGTSGETYLDLDNGLYYIWNTDYEQWDFVTQFTEYTANKVSSEISILADGISSRVTYGEAETLIEQKVDEIDLSVTQGNIGSDGVQTTRFTLTTDGTTLKTHDFAVYADVTTINGLLDVKGKIKANLIEASELKVDGANITGTLNASCLVGTTLSIDQLLATTGLYSNAIGIGGGGVFGAALVGSDKSVCILDNYVYWQDITINGTSYKVLCG